MQRISRASVAVCAAVATCLAGCAGAEDGALSYVGTLGVDTLFVEEHRAESAVSAGV